MGVHMRKPTDQTWIDLVLWSTPSVTEDKYIISSNAKNDENGQHMKNTDVSEIEDNPVD